MVSISSSPLPRDRQIYSRGSKVKRFGILLRISSRLRLLTRFEDDMRHSLPVQAGIFTETPNGQKLHTVLPSKFLKTKQRAYVIELLSLNAVNQ